MEYNWNGIVLIEPVIVVTSDTEYDYTPNRFACPTEWSLVHTHHYPAAAVGPANAQEEAPGQETMLEQCSNHDGQCFCSMLLCRWWLQHMGFEVRTVHTAQSRMLHDYHWPWMDTILDAT